jgi:hypothetical protein
MEMCQKQPGLATKGWAAQCWGKSVPVVHELGAVKVAPHLFQEYGIVLECSHVCWIESQCLLVSGGRIQSNE